MNKELSIALGCIVAALGLWGTSKYLQARPPAPAASAPRPAIIQAALATRAQVNAIAKDRAGDVATANAPLDRAGATAAAAPAAPVVPPESPEVKTFLAGLKITSVLLGEPSVVVINKKDYEAGGELAMPGGKRLRVSAIAEEGVTFTDGARTYRVDRR